MRLEKFLLFHIHICIYGMRQGIPKCEEKLPKLEVSRFIDQIPHTKYLIS